MLKLINFTIDGDILSMMVLIECDENMTYKMSVDLSTPYYSVVESDIPDDYKMYEVHARMALRNYKGKKLPETVVGAWY